MSAIRVVFFDWGDTLMRDFPDCAGPMAQWPRVEAMPGAERVLCELTISYRLAVATNADDSGEVLVREALAMVGLAPFIDFVVASCEVGARKPDPAFFAAALARADCAAAEAVMVGDSLRNDVGGAAAAGMRTVWLDLASHAAAPAVVANPERPVARPDAVIHILDELPAALTALEAALH